MTRYRVRLWGTTDWTQITIEAADEDDFGVEDVICARLEEQLENSGLHAQHWEPTVGWEDL